MASLPNDRRDCNHARPHATATASNTTSGSDFAPFDAHCPHGHTPNNPERRYTASLFVCLFEKLLSVDSREDLPAIGTVHSVAHKTGEDVSRTLECGKSFVRLRSTRKEDALRL